MAARSSQILTPQIGLFDYRNVLRIDWLMALLVLALAGIGMLTLYSASYSTYHGANYWQKQALFLGAGLGLVLVLVCVDHRFLVSIAPLLYLVSIGLLVAVLYAGVTAKGGQRWLELGPLRLQPSEQSKLVLVFTVTWYLNAIGKRIRNLFFFGLTFVFVGIPAVLILAQPNLGTTASLFPIVFVMLYAAGAKRWHLVTLVLIGLLCAPTAWSHLEDYQKDRLMAFVNPEKDPQDTGWQTIQSKITVGSGGMSGKGFLEGTQTRLRYLPEHHTDFIFSVLAEEQGFIGGVVVLLLFLLFLLRGLHFARDCDELTGSLLAVGCVTIVAFHVFVNVAITLGLMPVTGIPLPFLSYGGSFYITTMMCVGVLLNVHVRKGMFE